MSEMCSVCIVRAQRDDDDFLPCSPACFRVALRACEQRVRHEERSGAPVTMIELAGYSRGYAAGVQAALKVVEPWLENHSPIDDLMNTIDALKEKP